MFLFAHHMAVELFGREFTPHGTFEHVCAFGAIGLVLALSAYGAWTLVQNAWEGVRSRRGV
jgi:hypothetical protein